MAALKHINGDKRPQGITRLSTQELRNGGSILHSTCEIFRWEWYNAMSIVSKSNDPSTITDQ